MGLFKDFCLNVVQEQVPQFKFYEEIKKFEKIDANDDRRKKAREIYDTFIMRELLSNSGLYSKESAEHVQQLLQKNEVPPNLFELYVEEIFFLPSWEHLQAVRGQREVHQVLSVEEPGVEHP